MNEAELKQYLVELWDHLSSGARLFLEIAAQMDLAAISSATPEYRQRLSDHIEIAQRVLAEEEADGVMA